MAGSAKSGRQFAGLRMAKMLDDPNSLLTEADQAKADGWMRTSGGRLRPNSRHSAAGTWMSAHAKTGRWHGPERRGIKRQHPGYSTELSDSMIAVICSSK